MTAATFVMRGVGLLIIAVSALILLCVAVGVAISVHSAVERAIDRRLAARREARRDARKWNEIRELESWLR